MSTYAKNTTVPVGQSEQQIKAVLRKHGASQIMTAETENMIGIQFAMKGRHIRFAIPVPDFESDEVKYTAGGKMRTNAQRQTEADKLLRSRYRQLFLLVKGKLVSIESGAVTFEDEFLAHTVMSDGQTVGQWAKPAIAAMYETGDMPPLLADMSS